MLVRRIHATLLLSLPLSIALPTSAKTIPVPADQPTIKAGINTASNGDTVLVSAGTYYENTNFSGKAIATGTAGKTFLPAPSRPVIAPDRKPRIARAKAPRDGSNMYMESEPAARLANPRAVQ